MGEVWFAEDDKLHRPVALKRLTRGAQGDGEARRRMLREAQRACALNSDHIAGVYDVLEESGETFLVMEYVEGETLRQRLHRPVTLKEFFEIAPQCAEALAAAHQNAIVHCDVKPENIMLTPEGRVKVLDFGLAKHLPRSDQSSTLDRTGLFGGTSGYMAPEVLREQLPDARSDVFSLGVVLYEMLTRRRPFSAAGFVATSEQILHTTPPPIREYNPNVSAALEGVVMKALSKSPEQRQANGGELLRELRLLQDRTEPKPHPSASLNLNALWHSAIVIIASALAISLTTWWMHHRVRIPERGWVLISDFDNSGNPSLPDKGVREGFTIALQQSKYVNIFPRARAYEVLERMKKGDASRIDETLGREICQRESLPLLLGGTIERQGNVYQVTVRGVDPAQGTMMFAEIERFSREDEFFEKADALAKKIRKDMGESLDRIAKNSRALARVTTSSLAALQLYSRAKDAQYSGKEDEVESLLKGALQLDHDFAMAHLRLGQYYSAVVGKNEKALAEVERAYELRQSVSEREQHRIEAHYYDLQERYDEKAQALSVLVNLYPDDEEAHTELAFAYYDLGLLDKAIAESREALKLNAFSAPAYGGLVLYLARANRPEEALAVMQQASRRGVSSTRIHWAAGLALLAQGNTTEARKEFERMDAATQTERDLRNLCPVVVDLYEGKLRSARTELIRQIHTAAPNSGGLQSFRKYLLGRIHLTQGQLRNAELQADEILRIPVARFQSADLFNAGLLYVRGRSFTKARATLHQLSQATLRSASPQAQNDFHSLEGEIFEALGSLSNAENSFSISLPAFSTFAPVSGLARVYALEQRWDLAAEQAERVLNYRGEILQSGYPPDLFLAHVELARAYYILNRPTLAREQYEVALRMWTHADESSVLSDVKRELAKLSQPSSLEGQAALLEHK
jgi:serine/threonine protein kinase/tetratricopeptide (TPR) repeat protein